MNSSAPTISQTRDDFFGDVCALETRAGASGFGGGATPSVVLWCGLVAPGDRPLADAAGGTEEGARRGSVRICACSSSVSLWPGLELPRGIVRMRSSSTPGFDGERDGGTIMFAGGCDGERDAGVRGIVRICSCCSGVICAGREGPTNPDVRGGADGGPAGAGVIECAEYCAYGPETFEG
jgi:hypothetical protein